MGNPIIGSHGKIIALMEIVVCAFQLAVGVEKLILNFGLRLSVGCEILQSSPPPVVKYFVCGLVIGFGVFWLFCFVSHS